VGTPYWLANANTPGTILHAAGQSRQLVKIQSGIPNLAARCQPSALQNNTVLHCNTPVSLIASRNSPND
jgi:hypothetical protein